MTHLDDDTTAALVTDDLEASLRTAALEHLESCTPCRVVVAAAMQSIETTVADSDGPASGELEAGSSLGRFTITRQIGRGGMGVVYEAVDPTLDRPVAIKILSARCAIDGSEGGQRLLREARTLARVVHPNVVAVFEAGIAEPGLFLVMELVRGRSVEEWLRSKPEVPTILDVFAQAARGLAAVHDAGLVHRDFKPHNVIVGDDGLVKVVDFGLARLADTASSVPFDEAPAGAAGGDFFTRPGAFIGTPAYSSPEQLAGEPATPASDVFSFSASLWEALYGQRPFDGSSLARAQATILTRPRKPPAKPRLARRVRRLMGAGLALEPADRPTSMNAIGDVLSSPRAERARTWIAGGLAMAALASIATLAIAARQNGASSCEDRARTELASHWGADQQSVLGEALAASPSPLAKDSAPAILQRFERFGERWQAARTLACRAAPDLSPSIVSSQQRCFTRQLERSRAIGDRLLTGDRETGNRWIELTAGLPDASSCANVAHLVANPLPESAAARERIAAIDKRLAELRALAITGGAQTALAELATLVPEVERIGYKPLEVVALSSQARSQRELGHAGEAIETLKRAQWAAAASRETVAEATISADLAAALLEDRADSKGAADRLGHARALLERIDDPAVATEIRLVMLEVMVELDDDDAVDREMALAAASLEMVPAKDADELRFLIESRRAWIAEDRNQLGAALAGYQRTAELLESAYGETSEQLAVTLEGQARVLSRQDRDEEARAVLRRHAEVRSRLVGDDNEFQKLYYTTLIDQSGPEAIESLEKAIEHAVRVYGEVHPFVGEAVSSLSDAYSENNRPDDAVAASERSLRIAEALYTDGYFLGKMLMGLSISLYYRGDYARAEKLSAQSFERLNIPHSEPLRFAAIMGVGAAQWRQGKWAEMARTLEKARVVYQPAKAIYGDVYDPLLDMFDAIAACELATNAKGRATAIAAARLARDNFEVDELFAFGRDLETLDALDSWLERRER